MLQCGGAAQLIRKFTALSTGVVTDRPLYEGDLANANQPILTVMNTSRAHRPKGAHSANREAAVSESGKPGRNLKLPVLEATIKGRVSLVSPALDPGSTTIEVWVEGIQAQTRR